MPGDMSWMKARYDELNEKSLLWEPPTLEGPNQPRCQMDGKPTIMLSANNYLNLTTHPKVVAAMQHATTTYGAGSGSVRAIAGTMDIHLEAEKKVAEFKGVEASLIYSAGYTVNVGLIPTLVAGPQDVIISDELNHGSIIDGVRLTKASRAVYAHNDMGELEAVLKAHEGSDRKLIITDGVFSMEGDLANVPGLVAAKKKHNVQLMVDDAHGLGTMGPTGRGTVEHYGLEDDVDIISGTFSKSFASLGGVVAGPKEVINYIKHHGRSLIYSASISPASLGAALAALDIMETEHHHREKLHSNVARMRKGLVELGYNVGESETPVLPIYLGEEVRMLFFWKALFEEGVYTNAVIPPAVAPDDTLIRTSFMATHTHEQIDRALDVFERVGKLANLI